MDVAILFSGGKDSTYAIDFALKKNWNIKYLLSIKPTRTDCFLFHYATVEQTKELAKILNIPHKYVTCDVADPVKEAEIVKKVVKENRVQAVVLGGTGLQVTQIKSIQNALRPLFIEVFASHSGLDHEDVMQDMIKDGYRFIISQIASDGLTKEDLGMEINKDTLPEFFKRSETFGFHVGGEGGYFDTLVIDGPIFNKRLNLKKVERHMESENSGHLIVKKLEVVDKVEAKV